MKCSKRSLLALSLIASFPAVAGEVNISKLRLDLTDGKQSEYLTLKNDSPTEKSAFSISIKNWKQQSNINNPIDEKNASPENILNDTEDLAVFPKTIVVEPNQEKIIRVLIKNRNSALGNYSYRLFINQLQIQDETKPNMLSWKFNLSVPIFVAQKAEIGINNTPFEANYTRKDNLITFVNKSNYHFQIKKIKSNVGEQSMNFYVLPNMTQKLSVLPNAENIVLVTDKGDIKIK
jgi:P pilus assembly chaperone PapD